MSWLKTLWDFSRPHTIVGTTLSVSGLYLIAYALGNPADARLGALLLALFSCYGANIYITGLNQVCDIEIDRINKPQLPLVDGRWTPAMGKGVIGGAIIIAILLAIAGGRFLFLTVASSLLIGTLYSLPPIRLKRFHFWASACIFTVRGVLVNLLLFLHFNEVLNGDISIPRHVWVLTAFIFGLSLVIAWFKDIPDMEGDQRFRIATLSLKLGPRRVFQLGRGLLAACYLGMIIAGLAGMDGVHGPLLAASHIGLILLMWRRSRGVDLTDRSSMTKFYLFIWGLFFSEYIVFALLCLLA